MDNDDDNNNNQLGWKSFHGWLWLDVYSPLVFPLFLQVLLLDPGWTTTSCTNSATPLSLWWTEPGGQKRAVVATGSQVMWTLTWFGEIRTTRMTSWFNWQYVDPNICWERTWCDYIVHLFNLKSSDNSNYNCILMKLMLKACMLLSLLACDVLGRQKEDGCMLELINLSLTDLELEDRARVSQGGEKERPTWIHNWKHFGEKQTSSSNQTFLGASKKWKGKNIDTATVIPSVLASEHQSSLSAFSECQLLFSFFLLKGRNADVSRVLAAVTAQLLSSES